MRRESYLASIAALATFSSSICGAPLLYNGGTYSQDFDGLPTNVTNAAQVLTGKGPHEFTAVTGASGMTGWQFGNPSGSSSNTEFRSQNGSLSGATGRGTISFGTNGSTERSLGALDTSNQINVFGLVLKNNTSSTFDSFTLSYTGEQWRRGDISTADILQFAYSVGGSDIGTGTFTGIAALDVVSPNTSTTSTNVALDGNLPANQVAKSGGVVSGLNWLPGQTLVLRWTPQELSGQDDGLAIDDLTFTAAAIPEASTLVLTTLAAAGLGLGVYRKRAKRILCCR